MSSGTCFSLLQRFEWRKQETQKNERGMKNWTLVMKGARGLEERRVAVHSPLFLGLNPGSKNDSFRLISFTKRNGKRFIYLIRKGMSREEGDI